MANAQYNIKLINILKDILLRLHYNEPLESDQADLKQHLQHVSAVEILLIVQELKSADLGITSEDLMKFFDIYNKTFGQSLDAHVPEVHHPGHPAQVLKDENQTFQSILEQINEFLEVLENNQKQLPEDIIESLKEQMSLLGQFYNHYNRKEKLFFPILERYGHFTPARIMWGDDDRIRTLYKGAKRMTENLPHIEFKYVKKSYDVFASKFKEMIFQEEAFLLPIVLSIFNEDDWSAIEEESDAFGYCFGEPDAKWVPKDVTEDNNIDKAADEDTSPEHLAFGGGYLTIKEADHILNNLPLEITFVDKNGIFKYFNDKIASSEMMFVRTPISIGRSVANCHPPKSMKKVMRLIRDLKSKRRASESMWFKKKGQFIHITYKGVFDENGTYLGILEYVQDIQPFLDLPAEVKKELSALGE